MPPGPELAWLTLWEGHLALLYRGDAAAASEKTAQARALARSLRLSDLAVMADALEGMRLVAAGQIAEGLRRLDGTTTAAMAGEINLDAAGQACCYMLTACEQVWDYNRTLQWCDRVSEFVRRLHVQAGMTFCRRHYVGSLIWRGEWGRVEAEIHAMIREFEKVAPVYLPESFVRLGELRQRQGREEEAADLFARFEAHPLSLVGRAALLLDASPADPGGAVRLVERYFRQLAPDDALGRSQGSSLLVRAHLLRGHRGEAEAALAQLRALSVTAGTDGLRAVVLAAEGLIAAADGDLERARQRLEDALDLYHRAGSPFETARTRLELARVLRAAGRGAEAEREGRAALQALESMGAAGEAARARVPRGNAGDDRPRRRP